MTGGWQERLKAERDALSKNFNALTDFIESPEFKDLPVPDQVLLTEQRVAMNHYLAVLEKRSARLEVRE